ncbi:phospholipase D family protein [uncultured Sulfitobacter sp.]|uniref:phospholipase D family protein n=1 Tax=uncultured Sulfitobacter sp. TaxID=191468 RepID=UPI00260AB7DA|nr:phospholipase D family protein [uncultured Sulfitobacter sp.]
MNAEDAHREFDVLVTASEAYPRLETEFLKAKQEIVAGFRIFDPETTLYSDEARDVGEIWADLITHTLNRGVRIKIFTTDFDPVVRMDMHYYAWQCHHGLIAAGEASDQPENLSVDTGLHPARLGLLPRTVLWMRSVKEIRNQLHQLAKRVRVEDLLETAPQIKRLTRRVAGQLKPRLFPPPALVPVSHHQKLAVFDETRLYIGGLDLNDRRFDTPEHQRDGPETWHDIQVLVTGQIAREARNHLLTMDQAFHGHKVTRPEKLLRTLSAKRKFQLPYMSPKPVFSEIADAHRTAIGKSKQLIYFETQFFRDEALAQCLAARAREIPDLDLIMMLPAAPEDIAFTDTWGPDAAFGEHLQTKCVSILQEAFAERLFIGSPVQKRTKVTKGRDTHFDAPIIYLHAKVSVFDDHTGIVSSANLNGRSMSWDTEAGVATQTGAEVAQLKRRCFKHWLQDGFRQEFYNPRTALQAWSTLAATNTRCVPEERQGLVVPYNVQAAKEDAQFLPGVPPEMA